MTEFHQDEHIDPTAEISLAAVKERAVRGVVVLTGRTFFLSILTLIATGLLTVFLDPNEFGVFWIVSAVVSFLAYFSDIGLAAALIQKKEKVSSLDLKTTFTVQQLLVFALLLLLVVVTPFVTRLYSLSKEDVFLMYALGFSLLLSSLKTIPSVLLERELKFEKLVIPSVLEQLVYSFVTVFFAWKGFGVRSFTYAVLARGIVGFIAMYIIRPWRPGIALSKDSLRGLLKYGVPYQANTLLATAKDDGMTIVLGGILGTTGIGLLGWAQKWAQAPLRFFMDQVIKVTFPAFSRMQDEKDHLANSLNRSVFFISFLVYPSLIALLILAPILVEIIPKYEKWTPALVPLVLIGFGTVFAAVSTQLTNTLNAIGRIKTTFKLMVMWTVLTWIFVPILAIKYGVTGAAAGYALVSASSVVVYVVVRHYVEFSLKESALKPFISSLIMGAVMFVLAMNMSNSVLTVVILVLVGGAVYMSSIYLLVGKTIVNDAFKSFRTLVGKQKKIG